MNAFRTNWPLAMSAALALTLMSGVAHARGGGGGHAGGVGRSMAPVSHMATTPSPGVGLSGAHPAAGLPGGMLHHPYPNGVPRSPAAAAVTSPAMASRPQSVHGFAVTPTNGSAAAAAAAAALSISGIDSSPSPPPPDRVTPPSAIASPEPELAPIAPLSPQLQTQFATGGGVAQPNLALSPGTSSAASPSESAPSAPGGGGKSLADCMGFWDRETHMSKAEWKAACARTMQDYPTVQR
jgi:hypothetical protein